MPTDYKIWNSVALTSRERAALELIVGAWQAGAATDNDHVMFMLVRGGWEPEAAQHWISSVQSGDLALLYRSDRGWLKPRMRAVVALVSDSRTGQPVVSALHQDLEQLGRIVTYLHGAYDPARQQMSLAEVARALEVAPDQLKRLVGLSNLSCDDTAIVSGIQPLYWTSFEAFLDRALPMVRPTVTTPPLLPIAARIEQVEWTGLGPYRAPTTLRLTPMTVLVGANGAGKTTALLALRLLRELADWGWDESPTIDERISVDARELMIAATAELLRPGAPATETITWQLIAELHAQRPKLTETLRRVRPLPVDQAAAELANFHWGTGRWRDARGALVEHTMTPGELALTTATSPAAHSQLMALRQSLRQWWTSVSVARRRPTDPETSQKVMLPDVYEVDADAFEHLRRHARTVTGVKDLKIDDEGALRIVDARGVELDAHLVATGVVRAITILGVLLTPEPPPLFALDEVENYLHGNLAARLIDVMRSVSARTRIVLTTHSGRTLRCFKRSEVRVVRRGAEGSTIVALDDDPELRGIADIADLGDMIDDGYFASGM